MPPAQEILAQVLITLVNPEALLPLRVSNKLRNNLYYIFVTCLALTTQGGERRLFHSTVGPVHETSSEQCVSWDGKRGSFLSSSSLIQFTAVVAHSNF